MHHASFLDLWVYFEIMKHAPQHELQTFFPWRSRFYGWEFAGFLPHSSHIFPIDARGAVKRKEVHGSI
jgi:hypothetical protein